MALIQCTECGAMISDKAKSCPKCGCPVEHDDQVEESSNRPRRIGKWILVAVIAILAIGSGVAYFTMIKENIIKEALHKEPMVKLTPEFCKAVRKYNCLCDFENGFASVRNGEKWGAINTEGKEVVPCIYDMVNSFHDDLAAVCKNDKWGYVNTKGELIIPCIYEYANDFSEGLASVRKNGKEGFINKKGEIAIPFKFEECGNFSEGLAYAGDKKGHYFIDTDGNIKIHLPKGFYINTGSSNEGNPYPEFYNGTCNILVGDDYNYYINSKGEKVAPPKPQASTSTTTSEYEIYRNNDGLVGVKNVKTKKIVVPAKYSSIGESERGYDYIELHNGVVVATLAYKRLEMTSCTFEDSSDISQNTYTEYIYGYIDLKGNETFTSEDYKLVEEKNNDFNQDEFKWQQEKEKYDQQNDLSWLQGTWSGYAKYSKAVVNINGDYIRVTFGSSTTYDGLYTIENDKIIYDRESGGYSYFLLDRNSQRVMLDENTPMSKSSSSEYSDSSDEYSSDGDSRSFDSDQDVINYTSGNFYNNQNGMRISIKYNGLYVNGNHTPTFAPVVTSINGPRARIKINAVPNGTVYFTVDRSKGCIIAIDGTVWRKR